MKQATVNTFGALGYSSLLVQWFWTVLTIGLPLFTSDAAKKLFLPPEHTTNSEPILTLSLPSFVEITLIILSVVFALGMILYALFAVPRAIGRSGKRFTHNTAKLAAPRIAARQHLSKKAGRRLLERLTWTVKLLLVFIPVVLLAVPPGATLGLPHAVTAAAGILFGCVSLVLFAVQFVLARVWRVPPKHVW